MATDRIVHVAISLPESLNEEVEREAHQEHRETSDLVQEALEAYLRQKRLKHYYGYGQKRAFATGLTEADVPRLIAEIRKDSEGHGQ